MEKSSRQKSLGWTHRCTDTQRPLLYPLHLGGEGKNNISNHLQESIRETKSTENNGSNNKQQAISKRNITYINKISNRNTINTTSTIKTWTVSHYLKTFENMTRHIDLPYMFQNTLTH